MAAVSEGKCGWSSSDSCQKVRASCRAWMLEPQHNALVKIQASALTSLATDILSRHNKSESCSKSSSPIAIEWDEEQWHYQPSPQLPTVIAMERLALYILAMDAINFCFWPSHNNNNNTQQDQNATVENFEYEHLAMAMANMAQKDEDVQLAKYPTVLSPTYIFSPARLATLSLAEMTKLWEDSLADIVCIKTSTATPNSSTTSISKLDNMATRCQLWNEVGKVLVKDWDGSILKFLEVDPPRAAAAATTYSLSSLCGLSAPQLVDRILQSFPGFRDCCPWQQQQQQIHHSYLCLYKRAQICVGDWNASLQLKLKGLDQVTTFADYRVPQLLRHVGALEYSDSLGETIDTGHEILAGSLEEKTIRAATVVAVEDIVQELRQQQQQEKNGSTASPADNTHTHTDKQQVFTAVTVDWYLWQVGERMHNEGTLKCHHKTRTTFY